MYFSASALKFFNVQLILQQKFHTKYPFSLKCIPQGPLIKTIPLVKSANSAEVVNGLLLKV